MYTELTSVIYKAGKITANGTSGNCLDESSSPLYSAEVQLHFSSISYLQFVYLQICMYLYMHPNEHTGNYKSYKEKYMQL